MNRMWLAVFLGAALLAQTATDVLVGTDTRKLSTFQFITKPQLNAGKYTAETGGARIDLEVKKEPAGLEVVRLFAEPGQQPRTKTYRKFLLGKDGVYRTSGAQVRIPANPTGALILLESKSGIEEIPATFWILFEERKQQK
jgi:hypothetical protein